MDTRSEYTKWMDELNPPDDQPRQQVDPGTIMTFAAIVVVILAFIAFQIRGI